MPLPVPEDFLAPYAPANAFDDRSYGESYWVKSGSEVFYRHQPVRGADPASFQVYRGGFAKDARACYAQSKRLRGADPASFRALNFAYAADLEHVWTIAGEIKDAHRPTFEVCDGGAVSVGVVLVPTGYARDQSQVHFYNFDGKPHAVNKADAASFRSVDGVFALDDAHVFHEAAVLPAASPKSWRQLAGFYSVDGPRIYYMNRRVVGADAATFQVVDVRGIQLATDVGSFYENGVAVSRERFDELHPPGTSVP